MSYANVNTPSGALKKIRAFRNALNDLEDGLNGKPFEWGMTEAKHKQANLLNMGFTLCTVSFLDKKGFDLKDGVSPVGSRYYGAPLSRYADLYVFEIQTVAKKRRKQS